MIDPSGVTESASVLLRSAAVGLPGVPVKVVTNAVTGTGSAVTPVKASASGEPTIKPASAPSPPSVLAGVPLDEPFDEEQALGPTAARESAEAVTTVQERNLARMITSKRGRSMVFDRDHPTFFGLRSAVLNPRERSGTG